MTIPEFSLSVSEDGTAGLRDTQAGIRSRYERCVELKSLKLYIWSFRNEGGAFHEAVTNEILRDLVAETRLNRVSCV